MIRKAIQSDFQGIVRVLRAFRQDPVTPDYLKCDDEETKSAELFILRCLPHTFVAVEDSEVVGVIIGHMGVNPLLPHLSCIETVIWYVRDEYRNTNTGYILLKAWRDYAMELKVRGRVCRVLLSVQASTPVEMKRHGCELVQRTYEVLN